MPLLMRQSPAPPPAINNSPPRGLPPRQRAHQRGFSRRIGAQQAQYVTVLQRRQRHVEQALHLAIKYIQILHCQLFHARFLIRDSSAPESTSEKPVRQSAPSEYPPE